MTAVVLPCLRCGEPVTVPGDHTLIPELPLPGHECAPPDQAHPPRTRWRVEGHDGDAWMPLGTFTTDHAVRLECLAAYRAAARCWADGRPVEYRLVRETTTYTIEETDR